MWVGETGEGTVRYPLSGTEMIGDPDDMVCACARVYYNSVRNCILQKNVIQLILKDLETKFKKRLNEYISSYVKMQRKW